MRNISIALILALGLSSCEVVDKLTQFEMEYMQSFTLAAGTPLDVPFELITPSIETEYQAVYSQYDTRPDKVLLEDYVIDIHTVFFEDARVLGQ